MINEYQVVLNEFVTNYSYITSNFLRLVNSVSSSLFPILFVSAACSVTITFFRNLVK